ncbi:dipicolinic acid synthetase subunit A [Oceanobacillus alkalisoli]|uniref:dipicolinic acid synthetase subunit A n=1 Tax=Oceanobacillus alkalisoli TaxID=2925113 RepID=UPI001EEF950B|nr:dipicolinic acid synthetase subunit A [Oceanobacillus alkalisoli]MCF3942383.1 dipicolinic acid synthetase subunit A [Oceanobacillus alkalisoli]MCG5103440.1 dipicolinic acid synthetase subunit A [Oceanobacillus alkalisoli]
MEQLIAVIGGDARYLELIRQLQALPGISIVLIGFDKLDQSFTGLKQSDLSEIQPADLDGLILPITGTDESGNIETVFSDQPLQLTKEWFKNLKKSAIMFTGIANNFLKEQTEMNGIELVPLLNRDDVAIYNSIPTAEGAIMMAIEHTDYTIHSSNVVVTGFGRVGHTIANKFSSLGANVSVAAKSLSDLARITEMNLQAIPIEQLPDHLDQCDLLINTIPALVIKRTAIEKLPAHTVIIDLASNPGGTDFDFAEKRGIKAILAKSLPGIVAPKTSGKILANVITQVIEGRR